MLIAIACLCVYANSFGVPFLFDDIPNIVENPLIQRGDLLFGPSEYCALINPESLEATICQYFTQRYVGYLTFALNYRIHGLDTRGYHAVNLTIHLLNALLIYALIRMTGRTPYFRGSDQVQWKWAALLGGLLFAVHPVHTQAVTYIVQRLTSLAAFFYLLSLVLYVQARLLKQDSAKGPGGLAVTILYVLVLASLVLGMKTKEIMFTAPLTIALYEGMFFEGRARRRFGYLLPVLLTMAVIPLGLMGRDKPLDILLTEVIGSLRVQTETSRWEYFLTQFTVIVHYLRLLFAPVGLNLDYDWPLYQTFFSAAVAGSFLVLASIAGMGLYLWLHTRDRISALRQVSFGIFWFFIAVSVESSFIPISDLIFEHRVYLPGIGIIMAVSCFVSQQFTRLDKSRQKTLVMAPVICVMLLGSATFARNKVWGNEVRLWSDVVAKSPGKARAYLVLAVAYYKEGRLEQAIETVTRALDIKPHYASAYSNLATFYEIKGDRERALSNYDRAIMEDQSLSDAYFGRANVRASLGQYDAALVDYTRSIALRSAHADVYLNRANVYTLLNRIDEAVQDYSMAIRLRPDNASAYFNRGLSHYARSDAAAGELDMRKACELGNAGACAFLSSRPPNRQGP